MTVHDTPAHILGGDAIPLILPWGSIGSFALGEFLVRNPECYLLLTDGSVSSSSIEKELDLNVER